MDHIVPAPSERQVVPDASTFSSPEMLVTLNADGGGSGGSSPICDEEEGRDSLNVLHSEVQSSEVLVEPNVEPDALPLTFAANGLSASQELVAALTQDRANHSAFDSLGMPLSTLAGSADMSIAPAVRTEAHVGVVAPPQNWHSACRAFRPQRDSDWGRAVMDAVGLETEVSLEDVPSFKFDEEKALAEAKLAMQAVQEESYAQRLGLDAKTLVDEPWIVDGLQAFPLPHPWKEQQDPDIGVYYRNVAASRDQWSHPARETIHRTVTWLLHQRSSASSIHQVLEEVDNSHGELRERYALQLMQCGPDDWLALAQAELSIALPIRLAECFLRAMRTKCAHRLDLDNTAAQRIQRAWRHVRWRRTRPFSWNPRLHLENEVHRRRLARQRWVETVIHSQVVIAKHWRRKLARREYVIRHALKLKGTPCAREEAVALIQSAWRMHRRDRLARTVQTTVTSINWMSHQVGIEEPQVAPPEASDDDGCAPSSPLNAILFDELEEEHAANGVFLTAFSSAPLRERPSSIHAEDEPMPEAPPELDWQEEQGSDGQSEDLLELPPAEFEEYCQSSAALQIQSARRRTLAMQEADRRRARRRREHEEHGAALRIQSRYRVRTSKRDVDSLRRTRDEELHASTVLAADRPLREEASWHQWLDKRGLSQHCSEQLRSVGEDSDGYDSASVCTPFSDIDENISELETDDESEDFMFRSLADNRCSPAVKFKGPPHGYAADAPACSSMSQSQPIPPPSLSRRSRLSSKVVRRRVEFPPEADPPSASATLSAAAADVSTALTALTSRQSRPGNKAATTFQVSRRLDALSNPVQEFNRRDAQGSRQAPQSLLPSLAPPPGKLPRLSDKTLKPLDLGGEGGVDQFLSRPRRRLRPPGQGEVVSNASLAKGHSEIPVQGLPPLLAPQQQPKVAPRYAFAKPGPKPPGQRRPQRGADGPPFHKSPHQYRFSPGKLAPVLRSDHLS